MFRDSCFVFRENLGIRAGPEGTPRRAPGNSRVSGLVFRENPKGRVAGAGDCRRPCRAIAAPYRATARRKAVTGRRGTARQFGRLTKKGGRRVDT